MRTWEARPGLGLRERDLGWQARPGLHFQGPVPMLQASAKQLGRCPADLTPPQGRNCRAPVTRAAQIEVSSLESRCSPIFCMRWCRVGIQPVDKWLQFRLHFGWAKETVVCVCVSQWVLCLCVWKGECDYGALQVLSITAGPQYHCPWMMNDAAMQHEVFWEKVSLLRITEPNLNRIEKVLSLQLWTFICVMWQNLCCVRLFSLQKKWN